MQEEVKQILFGSLLGDGGITKDGCFSEKHSLNQHEYLQWKKIRLSKNLQFINDIFTKRGVYKFGDRDIYRNDILRIATKRAIASKNYLILDKLRKQFYSDGKKVITKEILYQLTLLGLSVWYCDDGNYDYNKNIVQFCTDKFTYEEHILFQKFLESKFNLVCFIRLFKKKYYRIFFNRKNTDKFLQLIQPIFEQYQIPECMWYKLGHLWRGNGEKLDVEKEKKKRYTTEWRPKHYQKRKSKNLCRNCVEKIDFEKHILCKKCREKMREYNKKHILKIKKQGLCYQCGKNVVEPIGYFSCQKCRRKEYERRNR